MPLADRNMFVALKQERFAGSNFAEVRHIFSQLVDCVDHMHRKGYLHADIKTLNIVRTGPKWKLIDLDASCVIGKGTVGSKSSSAYVPPEAVYVDESTRTAVVKSEASLALYKPGAFDLLIAHPSYDIWSLGCILYQLSTDARTLFQGGQDDNLRDDVTDEDNLWTLQSWTAEIKEKKLSRVKEPLARNLLAQMLSRDPLQRPDLARVIAHPFLSGRTVARLVGEAPAFDVFISYRVASDAQHVAKLYDLLTAKGVKVWWDKLCLEPGQNWEEGFCAGLVNSRTFVCLLSKGAINHPTIDRQNFSKLTATSACDNVFLEHRLALELRCLGLIERIFPLMIGDFDETSKKYGSFFGGGCFPKAPNVTVASVEEKLRHHMEAQSLGCPVEHEKAVSAVLKEIVDCQGCMIQGDPDYAFAAAVEGVLRMLKGYDVKDAEASGGGGVHHNFNEKHATVALDKHAEILSNVVSQNKIASPDNRTESTVVEELRRVIAEQEQEISRLRERMASIPSSGAAAPTGNVGIIQSVLNAAVSAGRPNKISPE